MTAAAGTLQAFRRRKATVRALGAAVAVVIAAATGLAPGCKKEQESLVIVAVQAKDDTGTTIADATIGDVTITLNGPTPSTNLVTSQVFRLSSAGIPITGLELGVYIPAGLSGSLSVNVVAHPRSGCLGYSSRGTVKVTAGDTLNLPLSLRPADVCSTMGTAGMGGNTGAGGGAGTTGTAGTTGRGGGGGSTPTGCGTAVGTPPATVAPPSLATCVSYDHNPSTIACSPTSGDIDNPYINDAVVSPDGQLLATSAADYYGDASVKIWRFQGNTPVGCGPLFSMDLFGPAFVAFSPNGQYFAVAWNGVYVDIYRVPSFTFVAEIKSSTAYLLGVAFSPDSQTVFSADSDHLGAGTLYADRVTGGAINSLPLSIDPRSLAVAPVAAAGGAVPIAIGSRDGYVATYTWDGSNFAGPTLLTAATGFDTWGLRFSPNGGLLAAGTTDGVVRFWAAPFTANATSGAPISIGAGITIWQTSFSPSGAHLAIAFGTEVDIWNVATRAFVSRFTLTPPAGATTTSAFSATFSGNGGAVVAGASLCGKFFVCSD